MIGKFVLIISAAIICVALVAFVVAVDDLHQMIYAMPKILQAVSDWRP